MQNYQNQPYTVSAPDEVQNNINEFLDELLSNRLAQVFSQFLRQSPYKILGFPIS